MIRPLMEAGFGSWREEVEARGDSYQREVQTPYIPIIALAGIYAAYTNSRSRLTSYDWRRRVLGNPDAMGGLRMSLQESVKDELDFDYPTSIDVYAPEAGASSQSRLAYQSIIDGLPDGVTTLPSKEIFLARTLGFARHDFAITLEPLSLTNDGLMAFRNFYPQSAGLVTQRT